MALNLNEILRDRKVLPDLTWLEEGLNYQPADSRPWESMIPALESELHPWDWQFSYIPEKKPGVPDRAKEDSIGFSSRFVEDDEFAKFFREASMASSTIGELSKALSSRFSKEKLVEERLTINKLGQILRGIEGHVFIDPTLFGSCKKAASFIHKNKLDPIYVLKTATNCLCGGDKVCLIMGKPLVSTVKLDRTALEKIAYRSQVLGKLSVSEYEELLKSELPVPVLIRKAALAIPQPKEVREYPSNVKSFTQYKGDLLATKFIEQFVDLVKEASIQVNQGKSIIAFYNEATLKLGKGRAKELLVQVIKKVGRLNVKDFPVNCNLPDVILAQKFSLVKDEKRCPGCVFFRGESCKKLGRVFYEEKSKVASTSKVDLLKEYKEINQVFSKKPAIALTSDDFYKSKEIKPVEEAVDLKSFGQSSNKSNFAKVFNK